MSDDKPQSKVKPLKDSDKPKKPPKKTVLNSNVDEFPRDLEEVVTNQPVLHENLLNYLAIHSKFDKSVYMSKPGKIPNPQENAYIKAINDAGMNNIMLTNLSGVNRGTIQSFVLQPAKYMTLHNMVVIYALTGLSIDRQVQLLLYGLTYAEHKASTRQNLRTAQSSLTFSEEWSRGSSRASRLVGPLVEPLEGGKDQSNNETMNLTGSISPGTHPEGAQPENRRPEPAARSTQAQKKRSKKSKAGRPKGVKNKPKPINDKGHIITPDISSGLLDL